ncbi:hypothetical protein BKA67DRAFT_179069 [Truncatella angustata]|uniref:N-acetyltransferase domain-containing protein n=1 Tax=Truncatella angustata TaxID=152316 RepID=A0A9P8URK8_9PEZI|nr:uncharacterized protein BKA67DRAFT_179069 [Truncatella angustata]KAH6657074.1 hypothetical protein BKA67DRAFT_179069 [Truncatella angustata]
MALPFATPASLDPAFVISRCEAADIDALSVIYYDSFKADPGNSHWWSPSREHMMTWMHKRISKKMSDPGVRHFKIIDVASNDIVAWARWDIPENSPHFGDWVGTEDVSSLVKSDPEPKDGAERSQEISASAPAVDTTPKTVDIPEGADPALCQNFFGALTKCSSKWHTKDMLGLSLICTAPKYHRRGAAKALIMPMLELADANDITAILEATAAGKPLYEKLRFREVDTMDFDLGKLTNGQTGLYQLAMMIRKPRSTR